MVDRGIGIDFDQPQFEVLVYHEVHSKQLKAELSLVILLL